MRHQYKLEGDHHGQLYYTYAARILINLQNLDFDSTNDYKAYFLISLGSMPLRGEVWVEPEVVCETDLNITISPTRVVLYENRTVVTATVEVLNVDAM